MPHQEMSRKSLVVNLVGPQPPPQRPEGKIRPRRGGQPERLQSERLKHKKSQTRGSAHQFEPLGPISSYPYLLVALSPSKGRPEGNFPRLDTGS
jgi:hypothetical protein